MSEVYQPSLVELVGLPGVGVAPALCGECKQVPVGDWVRLVEEAAPDNDKEVVFCAACWDVVYPLLVVLSEYLASGGPVQLAALGASMAGAECPATTAANKSALP